MGTTFTVNGVAYAPLANAAGKYGLDPFVWTPSQKVQRFHVNGVAGNFTVLAGSTGGAIACRVRYVNTAANCYSNYEGDVNGMVAASFSVTSPSGVTYTRCKLSSSSITFGPKPMNDGTGNCYMDAAFQIMCDGGVS